MCTNNQSWAGFTAALVPCLGLGYIFSAFNVFPLFSPNQESQVKINGHQNPGRGHMGHWLPYLLSVLGIPGFDSASAGGACQELA